MPAFLLDLAHSQDAPDWHPFKRARLRVVLHLEPEDRRVHPKEAHGRAFAILGRLVALARPTDLLPIEAPATLPRDSNPPRGPREWTPRLDRRSVQSVDRLLAIIARLADTGPGQEARAVKESEVRKQRGLSHSTLAKLLKPDTDLGRLVRRYLTVEADGSTKALRLTPEGRRRLAEVRLSDEWT